MVPSVHTSPHQGAPSNTSSMTLENMFDECDFDRLVSTIPDTQDTGGFPKTETTLKKLSPPENEISESSLAVGFSWQPKERVRPGQFSERPKQSVPRLPLLPLSGLPEDHSTEARQTNDKLRPQQTSNKDGQKPLELPELKFERTPDPHDNTQKEHRGPNLVPKEDLPSPVISGKQKTIERINHATPGSLFPGNQDSTFPLDQEARISDPADIKRTSAPFNGSSSFFTFSGPGSHDAREVNSGTTTAAPDRAKASEQSAHNEQGIPCRHDQNRRSNGLPSHIQLSDQGNRAHSPVSICGDLEGPVHQIPQESRQRRHNDRQRGSSHKSTQRSQSRTSNISKKRAAVHKSYQTEGSGRKKELMEQVAQHWNECMRLVEDEKRGAVREIRRLQDNITQKSKELKDTQVMMSCRQAQVQEMEDRYKKIEQEQSTVSQNNQQLSGEVQSLRKDLEESKQRESQMGEKYKAYKDKINDAITEQQDLYKRSRAYYQHMLHELDQERNKQNTKTVEIDEALELSQQKRAELREAFKGLQSQMQKESKEKDENILQLSTTIKNQEIDLLRERETVNHLQVQIDETQVNTHRTVQELGDKVNSLAKLCEQSHTDGQKGHEMIHELSEKLDNLSKSFTVAFENTSPSVDTESILGGLEATITSSIAPALFDIHEKHEKLEDTICSLGKDVQDELSSINYKIHWYMRQRIDGNRDKVMDTAVEILKSAQAELTKMKKILEEKDGQFTSWFQDELETLKADNDSRQAELVLHLNDRDNSLADREHQLKILVERFFEKVIHVEETLVSNDKIGEEALKAAVSQFQEHLDTALGKERGRSAQGLGQTHAAILSLKAQLMSMETTLRDSTKAHGSQDIDQLRQALEKEKATVFRLTEEVRKSDQLAVKTDKLRNKWTRDIQGISSIQDKLSAAHHRIPRIEGIAAKLDSIGRLNGLIYSTASYLSKEKTWVQDELVNRSQLKSIHATEQDTSRDPQLANMEGPEQPHSTPDCRTTTQSTQSTLQNPNEPENYAAERVSEDDPSFSPRRVTVLNPAMDFNSPSPPPSIEQEQTRRRARRNPRPILRCTTGSEQQAGSSKNETLNLPLNHSQYNRPVVSAQNKASSENADNEMVEKIRSGLLPTSHIEELWAFPTVAEFEQSNQHQAQDSQVDNKRHPPVTVDNIHNIAKRFKAGPQESSPGDLKTSVKNTMASARSTNKPH